MLDSLRLAREEGSCYYKYITWLDDDTYSFEEEILMTEDEEELSSDHVSLYARCVSSDDTRIYTNILIYVPDLTITSKQQVSGRCTAWWSWGWTGSPSST